MPRVIAITSGKGGVGKSNFVLNVGICLAMMEHRVQVLDADLGLANIDVLLGIRPRRTLEDVVFHNTDPRDIVIKTDYRIELIPGPSGTQDMADLSRERIESLVKKVMTISSDTEYLLVDTASGISASVISFLLAAPEVIVGVSPEPTSLTDAYAMIKVLKKNDYHGRISMFSSMVKNSVAGHTLYKKIASASQRFLDMHIDYLGSVYTDEKLKKAVSDQVPAVVRYPTSDISRAYRVIALTILGQEAPEVDQERFWSRLITMLVKNPRPKVMKEISYNGNEGNGTIESTIHDILSEQRKTRMLLERLVAKMDQDITTSN
ncbi:MAG TPA: MinD/ParA family protein [Deltaproteobacteria bacterium]|nr:MinD/ParA family protein [Deltaproteobacteria bacterium]HOI06416.1 MinD/ParA family protein [Deltaproteobacteria bacterium]